MAVHVSRSHEIVIRGKPNAVFPMFTPAGEETWVDGWRPEYLHPGGSDTVAGMIFRTRHGGEETLWSCVSWQPSCYGIRYARVTPGSRMGFVDVTCKDAGGGMTSATVTYELTSLSDEGDGVLSQFTSERFRTMLEDWRERIEAVLSRPSGGVPSAGSLTAS
jgi:hypothetical protein